MFQILGPSHFGIQVAEGGLGLYKAGGQFALRKALKEGVEEEITLYRGLNNSHVAYEDALKGVVKPNGGTASALEHNTVSTLNSPYTSWTTNPAVAENFALRPNGGGVVLESNIPMSKIVESPNLKQVVLKQNGKIVSESEVLVKGIVRGAKTNIVP